MRRYVFIGMGPCGETEEVLVKFKSHGGLEQGQLAKKLSFKASLRSFTKSRFKLCSCYGWTLCICPNIIFWSLKPEGYSFWNWSLGK